MLRKNFNIKRYNYRLIICGFMIVGLCACSTPHEVAPIRNLSPEHRSSVMNDGSRYGNIPEHYSTTSGVVPDLPSEQDIQYSGQISASEDQIRYDRNYKDTPKGIYTGAKYTVRHGDTLFYIAWISGNDYRLLAKHNGLVEPYNLVIGQQLDLSVPNRIKASQEDVKRYQSKQQSNGSSAIYAQSSANMSPDHLKSNSIVEQLSAKKPPAISSEAVKIAPHNVGKAGKAVKVEKIVPTEKAKPVKAVKVDSNAKTRTVDGIAWRWPVKGKILESYATNGKGIDIGGFAGQPIVATADGKVVYAGNALRGYGNLVIIKHNDEYLSAYAHNDKILVKEQQEVKAGQQIATMGQTGATSVRLHFEVRHRSRSMNPENYLP